MVPFDKEYYKICIIEPNIVSNRVSVSFSQFKIVTDTCQRQE